MRTTAIALSMSMRARQYSRITSAFRQASLRASRRFRFLKVMVSSRAGARAGRVRGTDRAVEERARRDSRA